MSSEHQDSAPHPVVRAGRRVTAVHPGADAFTALTVMRRNEVRHLPVIDGDRCVGLLTEGDLLRALTSAPSATSSADLTAGGLCHSPAPWVPAGSTLEVMAARMLADGSDAALVVSRGELVGMVTGTDVLGAVTGRWRTRGAVAAGER